VVAGVQVTWPLSKPVTSLAPGASLTVRISSKWRSAKVSLVRVNADGRGLGMVATKTLRKGSFTVTIPSNAPGRSYALRLAVAGHKRWSWITTPTGGSDQALPSQPVPAAAATPTPTPTTPAPFCGPEGELPASAFRAQVQPGAATVAAGSPLSYTIGNVGEGKLYPADGIDLVPEGSAGTAQAVGATLLAPGASLTRSLTIPAATPPGRYYLRQTVAITQCDYIYTVGFNSPVFEVTP
jgi:hypothetical protein